MQDAVRDMMIPEIREAFWSAPALWRFISRAEKRIFNRSAGTDDLLRPATSPESVRGWLISGCRSATRLGYFTFSTTSYSRFYFK